MTPRDGTGRRRGSALTMASLTIALVLALVVSVSQVAGQEGREASAHAAGLRAQYTAQAGVWAAAHHVVAGGSGNVGGSTTTASYAQQTVSDADNDGWGDFSAALSPGRFEGRTRDVGGGLLVIRARGAAEGQVRSVEALMERTTTALRPFSHAVLSDAALYLGGTVLTDGWSSDVGSYESHTVTATIAGRDVRDPTGGVASNALIDLYGGAHITGDANAGSSLTLSGTASVTGDTTPRTPATLPAPSWTVPGATDPDLKNWTIGVGHDGTLSRSAGTVTLVPGKYVFDEVHLGGSTTLRITGGPGDVVEVYVTDNDESFTLDAMAKIVVDPPGKGAGPTVVVYNAGQLRASAGSRINAPTATTRGDPVQFQYYSTFSTVAPFVHGVEVGSAGDFSGVFYVPGARLYCPSNAEFFGAGVFERVRAFGGAFFHYDESLASLDLSRGGVAGVPVVRLRCLRELR